MRPELVAICDRFDKQPASFAAWYTENFPSIRQVTSDYRELLANPEVEAVYVAVPHHLRQEIYTAAIAAGKHLMGEKPFGIDQAANRGVLEAARQHPELLVRCSSEFPFFPPVQRMGRMIEEQAFGRILEVNCGFLHSSDLDPNKPINWKRQIQFNGEYGCMGDLGMHACHVPFRAGWRPRNVRAILSKIVKERPNGRGEKEPCLTWDNATLFCETENSARRRVISTHHQIATDCARGDEHLVLGDPRNDGFRAVYDQDPRRLERAGLPAGRPVMAAVGYGPGNPLQEHYRGHF